MGKNKPRNRQFGHLKNLSSEHSDNEFAGELDSPSSPVCMPDTIRTTQRLAKSPKLDDEESESLVRFPDGLGPLAAQGSSSLGPVEAQDSDLLSTDAMDPRLVPDTATAETKDTDPDPKAKGILQSFRKSFRRLSLRKSFR